MAIEQVEKDGKQIWRNTIQPTLEDGTPIGGTQVIEADTLEALIDATNNSYTHLYRKNRELLRQEKLTGKAPEGAQTAAPSAQFQPSRPLTAEERMRLARELQDPEKIDSALDFALEAKFGAKPNAVSQSVSSTAHYSASLYAAQQAASWRDAHPEFYASQKNVYDIASWVKNRNLEFTIENFDRAYEDLAPALETAPPSVVRTDSNASSAAADGRITGHESRTTQRPEAAPVPTSVSRKTGTTRGEAKKTGVTQEQFRKMSNEERRKFLLTGQTLV